MVKKTRDTRILLIVTICSLIIPSIAIVLYFIPLKCVQFNEYPPVYYSVLRAIDLDYQWVLILSFFSFIFLVVFSIIMLITKLYKNNTYFLVNTIILIISLVLFVLSFIFAFCFFNNYPRLTQDLMRRFLRLKKLFLLQTDDQLVFFLKNDETRFSLRSINEMI